MHEILYRAGIFCYTEENETIAAKSESMSTIETTVLLGLTVAVWFSLPDTNKDWVIDLLIDSEKNCRVLYV